MQLKAVLLLLCNINFCLDTCSCPQIPILTELLPAAAATVQRACLSQTARYCLLVYSCRCELLTALRSHWKTCRAHSGGWCCLRTFKTAGGGKQVVADGCLHLRPQTWSRQHALMPLLLRWCTAVLIVLQATAGVLLQRSRHTGRGGSSSSRSSRRQGMQRGLPSVPWPVCCSGRGGVWGSQ